MTEMGIFRQPSPRDTQVRKTPEASVANACFSQLIGAFLSLSAGQTLPLNSTTLQSSFSG
jgi:hypothetical protein